MEENPGVTINLVQTPEQADGRLALYLQYFETQSSEVDIVQTDVIWTGILPAGFQKAAFCLNISWNC